MKEKFFLTMEFVENYLRDVVCQSFPFSDKEKNKLTFEVCFHIDLLDAERERRNPDILQCFAGLCYIIGGEFGKESDLLRLL